jgi:hypothetical protein
VLGVDAKVNLHASALGVVWVSGVKGIADDPVNLRAKLRCMHRSILEYVAVGNYAPKVEKLFPLYGKLKSSGMG